MNRLQILQLLADKISAQSYLEIGVEKGYTFLNLRIANKIGVDPDPASKANIIATSDDFFSTNNKTFDLIFIDGLHHADQVERDINNALSFLNDRGYIVCHDMLPETEEMQLVPRIQQIWMGDCWKAWVKLRCSRNDLNMYVINSDYGCGVIHNGNQNLLKVSDELTYSNFCLHKHEWMNIISVPEFIRKLGSNE